jgi:hypothetical protein
MSTTRCVVPLGDVEVYLSSSPPTPILPGENSNPLDWAVALASFSSLEASLWDRVVVISAMCGPAGGGISVEATRHYARSTSLSFYALRPGEVCVHRWCGALDPGQDGIAIPSSTTGPC